MFSFTIYSSIISVVLSSADSCRNIHIYILDTHRRNDKRRCNDNDRRRKTSLTEYLYLSLYCKSSKRVTQGLRVRGSWRPNRNCNILTPHSYGRQRCVFLVLQMLNRRPWGPLCWVLAFFTASYQHLLWTPTHQGPKSLRPGVAFLTTSRLQLALELQLNSTAVLTALYNSSTRTRSPTRSLKSHV